ncbi:HepT-like ribonuclease domain-containing protein [Parapedobacter lycopersici]|uniref:HepT-like ribonuclease domain-containing protein n=1 Tax=Parapedobacter lycopersici TaxID=1864939 RepID=UPI00214D7EDB|nr:DUF86 domain-containing protein [Parapedobacter lycopersici]
MDKSPSIYLLHIQDCISRIRAYTKNIDEQAFLRDFLIQDAVIRNFEVIGEAVKKINPAIRKKYPEIPWKNIAGMRDKLIHDYMGVDASAVWGVIEDVLPDFEQRIKHIIGEIAN